MVCLVKKQLNNTFCSKINNLFFVSHQSSSCLSSTSFTCTAARRMFLFTCSSAHSEKATDSAVMTRLSGFGSFSAKIPSPPEKLHSFFSPLSHCLALFFCLFYMAAALSRLSCGSSPPELCFPSPPHPDFVCVTVWVLLFTFSHLPDQLHLHQNRRPSPCF